MLMSFLVQGEVTRTDTYLFGHPSGQAFRSSVEFSHHLLWLYANDPENTGLTFLEDLKDRCNCRWCPGLSTAVQEDITTEKKLDEKDAPAFMMRKGEIVWLWTGQAKALQRLARIIDSPLWAAGVICDTPKEESVLNPKQAKRAPTGLMALSERESSSYSIVLCQFGEPGKRYDYVPQHYLLPWLARKDFLKAPEDGTEREEHPSCEHARTIVDKYSYFDDSDLGNLQPMIGAGMFFGAEKIFPGDPLRVRSANGEEDVLILNSNFVYRTKGADALVIGVIGNVYTTRDVADTHAITPQEFVKLPWRMRSTPHPDGGFLIWRRMNPDGIHAHFSVEDILGRWYETEAVYTWCLGLSAPVLGATEITERRKDRFTAIGWPPFDETGLLGDNTRDPFQSYLDEGNKKDLKDYPDSDEDEEAPPRKKANKKSGKKANKKTNKKANKKSTGTSN
jgi:hypothetical protein